MKYFGFIKNADHKFSSYTRKIRIFLSLEKKERETKISSKVNL